MSRIRRNRGTTPLCDLASSNSCLKETPATLFCLCSKVDQNTANFNRTNNRRNDGNNCANCESENPRSVV